MKKWALLIGYCMPYVFLAMYMDAAWGTMIASTNDDTILKYHLNMWLPAGLLIVVAVLGFNFIGDGLRDALDPKMRR